MMIIAIAIVFFDSQHSSRCVHSCYGQKESRTRKRKNIFVFNFRVSTGIAWKSARELNTKIMEETAEKQKKNDGEMVYLDQIRHLLDHGQRREDRTGTGTLSIFGMQGRYDIRDGVIPLLTTKKVFWKSIVEEVLWFIRGETSSRSLADRGVHIWDANGSRTFLDSQGFVDRQEGDLGPVYGFQWRHFGAEYRGTGVDYRGEGVDQLNEVIRLIRTDPHSRRIILSAWNPTDLSLMALPPCHLLVQFYVQDGYLSSHLYQRSGDMGLGVPFNIASYALLTHMIAHVTGLKTGEFVHTLGDAHIYMNHVDALKEQLSRKPKQFPTVQFIGQLNEVDDFGTESIQLIGYDPHPVIKMPMAV